MKVLEESARRFHEEGQKLRGLPGGGHFYDPDWRPPPGAGGCYFPVYEPIDWGVLGMPGAVLRADPIITILPTPIPTPTPTPGRPFKYGEEY